MRTVSLLLLLLGVLALSLVSASTQTCLDESGEAVDWFVIVKVPIDSSSRSSNVAKGSAYLYGDAHSHSKSSHFWTNSSEEVTSDTSSVGRTLSQLYKGASSKDNGFIMYNDELPDGTVSDSYGHSKGMLSWSSSGGFWLIHSVPQYAGSPPQTKDYSYPSSSLEYGQSMLCISMDLENVDKVFQQFQYTNPQVYGNQWVSSLASQLPNGDAFVNQGTVNKAAATNTVSISSVGGMSFTHFAKTAAWGKSIFGDLIGPYYHSTIVVESWERPYEGPLTSGVQEHVYSVMSLAAPEYASWDGVTWSESQDHAKWCVTNTKTTPVLCIGDINKQQSQWTRSGGMACMKDTTMHEVYVALITKTDEGSLPTVALA